MGISTLRREDKAVIKRVACLHMALLPTSPIALLGSTFMERFYYSRLLKNDLIHCDYYEYNGDIVGFIAYTRYSSNLLKKGLHKNFFYLTGLMIFIFLQKPHKIVKILGVLRLNKGIKTEDKHECAILSFGILPDYRDRSFINKTGVFISHELFEHTLNFFRNKNISKIIMLIEPDNKEALLFYHYYGCQFQKIDLVGMPMIRVAYKIE